MHLLFIVTNIEGCDVTIGYRIFTVAYSEIEVIWPWSALIGVTPHLIDDPWHEIMTDLFLKCQTLLCVPYFRDGTKVHFGQQIQTAEQRVEMLQQSFAWAGQSGYQPSWPVSLVTSLLQIPFPCLSDFLVLCIDLNVSLSVLRFGRDGGLQSSNDDLSGDSAAAPLQDSPLHLTETGACCDVRGRYRSPAFVLSEWKNWPPLSETPNTLKYSPVLEGMTCHDKITNHEIDLSDTS